MKQILTNKYFIVIFVFVVGVAAGRFSLPAKVITQIETQTIEKIVYKESKDINKDKVVVIEETINPDGSKTKKTTITDKSTITVNKDQTTDTASNSHSETVVDYGKNAFMISALASTSILTDNQQSIAFGAHVQKRLLGPIYAGMFGFTDKRFGVSLGLTF